MTKYPAQKTSPIIIPEVSCSKRSILKKTNAWNKLHKHYQTMPHASMREMLAKDTERFYKYSITFENILIGIHLDLIKSYKIRSVFFLQNLN